MREYPNITHYLTQRISLTLPHLGTMSRMENLSLLELLNPRQQEAVTSPFSHVLVLAGAGSGKTRVLTRRIAWLIQQQNVSPYNILAVTFTNKAAYEMRLRIEAMLGMPIGGAMWVGTFHGLAHRLLRAHCKEASLPQSFQILDADDQYRLIRRMQRNLNLEESQYTSKQTQWFINNQKEEGRRSHQVIDDDSSYFTKTLVKVYKVYEDVCYQSGLVDFVELLLRTLELLSNSAAIREYYQQRFQHILVDEFQDTNTIQYSWLKALVGEQTAFMAVGDDDQSIYSWRGAKIENIHHFSRDFTDVKTIRLEQNYRSTQTILDAANAVIDNNKNRFGKKLWTEDSRGGESITLYTAFNERDEAFYVISCIEEAKQRQERSYKDIAILYRSNVQSRLFEECLIDRKIPYRIYGGLKFFERAEIKDALAYLRLIANRHDDMAFERVVNVPTRSIGNTTLLALRTTSHNRDISLWEAAQHLIDHQDLNKRALNALWHFIELIENLEYETKNLRLSEQTEKMFTQTGLLALYKKDKSEKGLSRVENLEELINATSQFTPTDDLPLSLLDTFLSHVALETGEDQTRAHSDCVSLMTLHAAKGLEFPLVIISGLEEDLFPHHMSVDTSNGLEEERRLCYVGMTRAREKLILTYAASRRLHGLEKFNPPSRFIKEIPPELIDVVRPTLKIARPTIVTRRFMVGK